MKIFLQEYLKLLLITFALIVFQTHSSIASELELITVKNEEALCNNGEKANYWIANQNSSKWLIQLPGGGAAWDKKNYTKRNKDKKKPAKGKDGSKKLISKSAIAKQFYDLGYNIIKFHYCSSDLYAGDHINSINGKDVPFKGRKIVEAIISENLNSLNNAEDLVIAGTSAGVYGIVLNLDLWSKLKNVRLILDGIWRDDYQKSLQKTDNGWTKFPLGNMPTHCSGDFYKNCDVSRSTLKKHNIKNAFLIFNFGDPYNWAKKDNQKKKFIESFKADAEIFGGGFSIDAKKYKLSGAEKWGHGLLDETKFYDKQIDKVSLSSTILEWIKNNKTIYIKY
ncbi:pectin acetylesterase-family hydrolase [Candidatus Pelagibacter ubique]|nr:pectin acetylesterase-family hydrolase [Candidatus Pelagibacter ubique]